MSEEQQTLLLIRGTIASMSTDEQHRINQAYLELRDWEAKHKADDARIAIGLRGAEFAAED